MLLVINGAPAVGKTTLGQRWAADHPLALVVDVDRLRTQLGGWQQNEETKAVARDLAIGLARAHLDAGHDVVVPQYIGRPEFVARLRTLADAADTRFVEVVLIDDPQRIAERFRVRRTARAQSATPHPEGDVDDAAVDRVVADANAGLARAAAARGAMIVDASGGPERAYQELHARTAEATP